MGFTVASMAIRRIRGALQREKYEFTLHTLEEMDEDDLTESDVRGGMMHGRVVATLSAGVLSLWLGPSRANLAGALCDPADRFRDRRSGAGPLHFLS